MKNIVKWTILFFIITLSGCFLPYPRTYSSEELEGRIVDRDTGEPLEGVNVVAYWELYELGFEALDNGVIKVMETVTDADGRFHFPAWEPELVLRAGTLYKGIQLTFFKSGYVVIGESNYSERWTVQPIKLWKFKENVKEEHSSNLSRLDTQLRFIEDDCLWQKIPHTLLAISQEFRRFKKLYGYGVGSVINIEQYLYSSDKEKYFIRKCGISPRDVFKSYPQQ